MTVATRKPHPLEGMVQGRWWAIINAHGKISEAHAMRAFAEGSLSVRGDGAKCLLAEVEVKVTRIEESARK